MRNSQIIIYGKKDHPEVVGLTGQTENSAVVISDPEKLDESQAEKACEPLFTDYHGYGWVQKLRDELRRRVEKDGKPDQSLEINDTICRHISHRQPGIRKFASGNDVIIFVAGKKSSNGKVLFDVCRSVNARSHLVSYPEEVKEDWFVNATSAGICGATSTPRWLLEDVARKVAEFTKN